jgi:hypothetical protein
MFQQILHIHCRANPFMFQTFSWWFTAADENTDMPKDVKFFFTCENSVTQEIIFQNFCAYVSQTAI